MSFTFNKQKTIKKHIIKVLKEGLEKEIITKEEYTAMDPSDKTASRFTVI